RTLVHAPGAGMVCPFIAVIFGRGPGNARLRSGADSTGGARLCQARNGGRCASYVYPPARQNLAPPKSGDSFILKEIYEGAAHFEKSALHIVARLAEGLFDSQLHDVRIAIIILICFLRNLL